MPAYQVTSPDGKTWEVTAPEGATQDQVLAYAKSQWAAQVKEPPAAVQAGKTLSGIPRQLGLTARYALEGPAQAAEIVTEPIRAGLEALGVPKMQRTGQAASGLADTLGLPSPEGANERVIGDATRLMAGAGGLVGAAGSAAQSAGGMAGKVLSGMAANPSQQLASAAGAGLAGGSVREAGGGPWAQMTAALAGGVAAPSVLSVGDKALRAARSAADWVVPRPSTTTKVDQKIELIMKQAGIDWSQVNERAKQGLRAEVSEAMKTGGTLNPEAVRRLLDFKQVPGSVATRGMITQDPAMITREQNLAKVGANSLDIGLQKLPRMQNDNNAALIRAINDAGAANAPSQYQAGEAMLGALKGSAAASKGRIDALYSAARDTAGRSAPLDGYAFTQRANQMLDERMVGGALPQDVANTMNKIAKGEMPFTVEIAEQIKTRIGNLQRSTSDGSARMALGVVRSALDDTPLMNTQVNPGNLPAVPGTVPPSQAGLADESIKAFNRARAANRAFMSRVERTPALAAAMEDVAPDQFMQKFVLGQGASARDVTAMRRAIGTDPQALGAVKSTMVDYLKQQALSGAADDVGKFSQAGYNKALDRIGEAKLKVFFTEPEIEQLRAIGRAASYMQNQPVGSAVNNSNSGALVVGKALEALDRIAGKLPAGLNTTIQGLLQGAQQGQATRVAPSLLLPQPSMSVGQRVGTPAIFGGLLATQPVPDR